MAIVLNENSYKGRQIIEKGSKWVGNTLRQIYDNWSSEKEKAYNECCDKYENTPDHDAFSICSANSYGFTCSWLGKYEGQDALFYETKSNSYVVLFEN